MAARLNKRQLASSLAAGNCKRTLGRLQKHVDGEIELTSTQIAAARIILDKSIPNAPTLNAELDAAEVAEWQLKL